MLTYADVCWHTHRCRRSLHRRRELRLLVPACSSSSLWYAVFLLYWYKRTNRPLLYWYKRTNTDAGGAGLVAPYLGPHSGRPQAQPNSPLPQRQASVFCLLTYAHVCSRMLTYAHVCTPNSPLPQRQASVFCLLAYAQVCWRMLTYADVCWRAAAAP
jgi:hypothetical protein